LAYLRLSRSDTGGAPIFVSTSGPIFIVTATRIFNLPLERVQRRDLLAWLLPVALATTRASPIAAALMDEVRQRQIIAPGPSVIERIVAAAVLLAERQVSAQLTKGLTVSQTEALEALLKTKEGTALSALVWDRQAPGAPSSCRPRRGRVARPAKTLA
jgi:hypothetical protein